MRKVYFWFLTGPIGLEVLSAKVFLYYLESLRKNGIEPIVVMTNRTHNNFLNSLIKKKFNEIGVKYFDISNNKLLSILYHRIILRKSINLKCFGMGVIHHPGNTKRYYDHIIHSGYKYAEVGTTQYDFAEMNDTKIAFTFSEEQHKSAQENLNKMQINKDFVCVHARDTAFYTNPKNRGIQQKLKLENPQNIDFRSYLQACNYLAESGLQTLRMGAIQALVEKELFNENIIDYAGEHRSEFMDIWTIAHCKFFLGSNSGLFNVSYLFSTPNAIANYAAGDLLYAVPYGNKDIYIIQKLWDKNRKRLLTYREIADSDIGLDCWTLERYEKEGLEIIKSTPEEICALAREMNEVLDGKFQYTEEDNYLQQKFKSIFKVYHAPYHSPARVGREFLQQNKELFL